MLSNRLIHDGVESVSPYIRFATWPLKPIARAISSFEAVQHAMLGARQFFVGPFWNEDEQKKHGAVVASQKAVDKTIDFWEGADETRGTLLQSFSTNFNNYVLPLLMYRYAAHMTKRGVNYYADGYDDVVDVVDTAVMLGIFLPIFAKRLVDNIVYSVNLPRAVNNDINKYLPKAVSEELSGRLAHMFQKTFSRYSQGHATKKLQEKLKAPEHAAEVQEYISSHAAADLSKPVAQIFQRIYTKPADPKSLESFRRKLASNNVKKHLPDAVSQELSAYLANMLQKFFDPKEDLEFGKVLRQALKTMLQDEYNALFIQIEQGQDKPQEFEEAFALKLKETIKENFLELQIDERVEAVAAILSVLTGHHFKNMFASKNASLLTFDQESATTMLVKYYGSHASVLAQGLFQIDGVFQNIFFQLMNRDSVELLTAELQTQLQEHGSAFFAPGKLNAANAEAIEKALQTLFTNAVAKHFNINKSDKKLVGASRALAAISLCSFARAFSPSFVPHADYDGNQIVGKSHGLKIEDNRNVFQVFQFLYSRFAYEESEKSLGPKLQAVLLSGYNEFFDSEKITSENFKHIRRPLKIILANTLSEHFAIHASDPKIIGVATTVGSMIQNEFASAIYSSNTRKLGEDIANLKSVLDTSFTPRMGGLASDFHTKIMNARFQVQSFLPIQHINPCECAQEDKVHADLTSPIYYIGNLLFVGALQAFSMMSREGMTALQMVLQYNNKVKPLLSYVLDAGHLGLYGFDFAVFGLKFMLYGQSFNEFKLAREKPCTMHRNDILTRNKAHSMGIGAAYYLLTCSIVKMLSFAGNLDNLFLGSDQEQSSLQQMLGFMVTFMLRDAVANMVMQFGSASLLAFNEKLPGNAAQATSWNYFWLSEEAMRRSKPWVQMLFEKTKDPVTKVKNLCKNTWKSPTFNRSVDFLLGGSALMPHWGLLMPWGKVQRPDEVILNLPSVKTLMRLYNKDILDGIKTVENFSDMAVTWMGKLLLNLPLPLPRVVMSFIVRPLRLMQDKEINAMVGQCFKTVRDFYLGADGVHLLQVPEVVVQEMKKKAEAEKRNARNLPDAPPILHSHPPAPKEQLVVSVYNQETSAMMHKRDANGEVKVSCFNGPINILTAIDGEYFARQDATPAPSSTLRHREVESNDQTSENAAAAEHKTPVSTARRFETASPDLTTDVTRGAQKAFGLLTSLGHFGYRGLKSTIKEAGRDIGILPPKKKEEHRTSFTRK